MIIEPVQHGLNRCAAMDFHLFDLRAKLARNGASWRIAPEQAPADESAAHPWERAPIRALGISRGLRVQNAKSAFCRDCKPQGVQESGFVANAQSLGCKIEWIMRNSAPVLNELPDR